MGQECNESRRLRRLMVKFYDGLDETNILLVRRQPRWRSMYVIILSRVAVAQQPQCM